MTDTTQPPSSDNPLRGNLTPPQWVLLERYLAGECSDTEQAAVEQWIHENAEVASIVLILRKATDRTAQMVPVFDQSPGWTRVQQRLAVPLVLPTPRLSGRGILAADRYRPRHQVWRRSVGMGAAAMAMVAVIGMAAWRVAHPANRGQPFREFTTPPGTRSTITLRDGTSLVLGPDTRLRISTDFGVHDRSVELDGMAEFHVVPDARRPFTVHTLSTVTRDIGTQFVVRAYAEDADTRIAVAEGEVAVSPIGRAMVTATIDLRAGSTMSLTTGGTPIVRRGVSVTSDFVWLQGGLAFEDVPLRQVLRQIARTYAVRITLADTSLGDKRITSAFQSESLDEILAIVTLAVGGHYERVGRAITVRRGTASIRDRSPPPRPLLNMTQARIREE